jgi:SAM-dependent methyltransferase
LTLVERGFRVVAVPLDPVISGAVHAKGVEIVEGNLETAREKLKGEQFDCLLLQNVLHLLPNPARLLSNYANLLSKNAVVVALVPNLSSLSSVWRRIRFGELLRRWGSFENSGVQFTHRRLLRQWFHGAGIGIEKPSVPLGLLRSLGTCLFSDRFQILNLLSWGGSCDERIATSFGHHSYLQSGRSFARRSG